jgi:hypothetical protein
VCDERRVGKSGEYCDEIDAYHETFGGKFVPRAVLFDLEPGVIGAVTLSRRSANSSARKTS